MASETFFAHFQKERKFFQNVKLNSKSCHFDNDDNNDDDDDNDDNDDNNDDDGVVQPLIIIKWEKHWGEKLPY